MENQQPCPTCSGLNTSEVNGRTRIQVPEDFGLPQGEEQGSQIAQAMRATQMLGESLAAVPGPMVGPMPEIQGDASPSQPTATQPMFQKLTQPPPLPTISGAQVDTVALAGDVISSMGRGLSRRQVYFTLGESDAADVVGGQTLTSWRQDLYKDDPRRIDEGPRRLSNIDGVDVPFFRDCGLWSGKYHLTYHGEAAFKCTARAVTFHADDYRAFRRKLAKAMADVHGEMVKEGNTCIAGWKAKSATQLQRALEGDLQRKTLQTFKRIGDEYTDGFDPCRNNCGSGLYCDFQLSILSSKLSGIRIHSNIYIPPSEALAPAVWLGPGPQVVNVYGWATIAYYATFVAKLACNCAKAQPVKNPSPK